MTDTTRLKEAAQRLLDEMYAIQTNTGYVYMTALKTRLEELRSALAAPPGSDALQGEAEPVAWMHPVTGAAMADAIYQATKQGYPEKVAGFKP